MSNRVLVFVVATRENSERFYTDTPLGQSLSVLRKAGIQFKIILKHSNKEGLPLLYNTVLKPEFKDHIVVFVHDDVFIDDCFIADRLCEGLMRYDMIGVVGNLRCANKQSAWSFPQKIGEWDLPTNLAGRIKHRLKDGSQVLSIYGDIANQKFPQHHAEVILLDGAFIAADANRLIDHRIKFDEQFTFHHYDLDVCLQAKKAGLKIGVWPITLTHSSGGNYKSKEWIASREQFVKKYWPES